MGKVSWDVLKGKPESERQLRVSGDGHGGQPFSPPPPEPGCQLPMAERPAPELPLPVPVTWHPKLHLPLVN